MTPRRLFKGSILPAAVVATLLAPLPVLAQDSASTFGETIDVRVVNVEAVVTDRGGTRVFGLTPDDFLLLVDGDPLADITILQDHDRLNYIMKDGRFHKEHAEDDHTPPAPQASDLVHDVAERVVVQRP